MERNIFLIITLFSKINKKINILFQLFLFYKVLEFEIIYSLKSPQEIPTNEEEAYR